jgi:hypothetical protein
MVISVTMERAVLASRRRNDEKAILFSTSLTHRFNGEHYWEINKAGYPLARIQHDLDQVTPMTLLRTYRVPEYSYHRFFVYQRELVDGQPD